MNLGTLTDRQLMQHWDVAARICVATRDPDVLDRYNQQMRLLDAEMNRRDAERRPKRPPSARFPQNGGFPTALTAF